MTFEPSPDRPAPFAYRLLGIKDVEPPLSDEEYGRFKQFSDCRDFIPPQVRKSLPEYPTVANRRTRAAIRRLLTDPRLPDIVTLAEREQALALAARKAADDERKAAEAKAQAEDLKAKLAEVEAFHDNQLNDLRFEVGQFAKLISGASLSEAALKMAHDSQSEYTKNKRALNISLAQKGDGAASVGFGILANMENNSRDNSDARKIEAALLQVAIGRSLVTMSDAERAALRMTDVLAVLGVVDDAERMRIMVPVIWNDGQCDVDFSRSSAEFRVRAAILETLRPLIAANFGTSEGARERLNQAVRRAIDPATGAPASQREIIERYLYSGNHWMTPNEAPPAKDAVTALRLGGFPDGPDFLYDRAESLVTIAPPGSGKSQSHVLRNLLYLQAPAVVLDVKGEMLRDSRAWRDAHVGKTYVFMPQAPDESIHYNPLDDVSSDPELAWEDARKLADLIVIPAAARDSGDYFEGRARDMITTALLDVAISETADERNMGAVLDRLYMSDDEDVLKWCVQLSNSGNAQLARQAKALQGLPAKQREGVFDSARRQLEIWQSPAITKITQKTTFDPNVLRAERATLYLAVALEDIKKYASVLRVIIGQTLQKLYRQKPALGTPPVTFFLDELPRLGRMDVIEESLDMGRGFGVRLWMFCQNVGQLETAYSNAQGMMSNCAVRCFMNPDEDSARWLSQNLSTRQGLLDGTRKPLVEAHQLTGPEFAEQIIVFSRSAPPARLEKKPAYADSVCQLRMSGIAEENTTALTPLADNALGDAPPEEQAKHSLAWEDIGPPPPELEPHRNDAAPRASVSPRWIAAFACIAVALSAWLSVREYQVRSLQTDVQNLTGERNEALQARRNDSAALQQARTQIDQATRSLREVTQARDSARTEAIATRADLQRERDAHAATKQKLALLESKPPPPPVTAPVAATPPPLPPVIEIPTRQVGPQIAAAGVPLPLPASEITPCDELAANPNDARHVGLGVPFSQLRRNAMAAIAACDTAIAARPDERRFSYQKARALHAANDSRALPILETLMRERYAAAFDNAGQLMADRERWQEAASLYRQGIALDDVDSMVALADAIRMGHVPPARPDEDGALYALAASRGHKGAIAAVQQRAAGAAITDGILRYFRSR